MSMRTRATTAVTVDVIGTMGELGEMAKLGSKLGYRVTIDNAPAPQQGDAVYLERRGQPLSVIDELLSLVLVESMAHDRAPARTLELVRGELERIGAPIDKPFSDALEIGGGWRPGR